MKRDADQVISGYANPNGSGAGNWSARRHISEQPIGHMQRRRTRRGMELGLTVYRPFVQAEPWQHDTWRTVREIVGGLIVCALFVVGAWLWSGIAWAAQIPTP